jgi:hypothetical protein
MQAGVRSGDGMALNRLARQARTLAASLAKAANATAVVDGARAADDRDAERAWLEDAALAAVARDYLKARRLRDALFGPGLFCDPAWDMLLDLFASQVEGKQVCVSDASIAANVPQTTGLRWVDTLAREGLALRRSDPNDGRRCIVDLTPTARMAMAQWLRSAFPEEALLAGAIRKRSIPGPKRR